MIGMRGQAGVRARAGDRGSVTLFAVSCAGLLLLLGAALSVVSAYVVDHREAQSAADLAALAAATAAGQGQDACTAGGGVAEANGAELTGCRVEGRDVVVVVSVPGPRWLGSDGDLDATSRAGPVD